MPKGLVPTLVRTSNPRPLSELLHLHREGAGVVVLVQGQRLALHLPAVLGADDRFVFGLQISLGTFLADRLADTLHDGVEVQLRHREFETVQRHLVVADVLVGELRVDCDTVGNQEIVHQFLGGLFCIGLHGLLLALALSTGVGICSRSRCCSRGFYNLIRGCRSRSFGCCMFCRRNGDALFSEVVLVALELVFRFLFTFGTDHPTSYDFTGAGTLNRSNLSDLTNCELESHLEFSVSFVDVGNYIKIPGFVQSESVTVNLIYCLQVFVFLR
ncbi:hypothetical protein RsoM2USA_295 [Ralstonia phage RsoM2USA]|nr:hypothetical protein RsoM2USA_295 [Ralstonia phage RsoM2USA]